ncbi:hypothetical protein [Dyella sp. C9]|uniref:hypothetical protein n=1 Tax=Dyella sp. C9 TaxID=2202154 RepID=UPI000DEF000A|nr:hypothetical protein [Dyella sp. C9]
MKAEALGVLIPVAAIAGWYIHGIFSEKYQAQRDIAQAKGGQVDQMLAAQATSQQTIQASLDSMDKRLARIEKLLEEIPS